MEPSRSQDNAINQDLKEYIILHRKNFKFENVGKQELTLPKPKGSLKFVPIEQWTPEYHSSIIQYQPTPLSVFPEDNDIISSEEDSESESEESHSLSAEELNELSEKMILKTERKRKANLERVGLYEKIMLETEKIQMQTILKYLDNPNVDSSIIFF